MTADTIYALSSGSPPAAIAVIRISGPAAAATLRKISGTLPQPRLARLRALRDPGTGELLDRALILFFPGPASATGEDLAELHLHGGRSIVNAVKEVLGQVGLREAQPGEFTRRAFENGRIDLAEAEGLADLLSAETQSQRRAALAMAGGALSRKVAEWEGQLLMLSAQLEAILDFSDEDDAPASLSVTWRNSLASLREDMSCLIEAPPIERLKEGVRVVIAGPPNVGKSTLLNRLVGRQAAITSDIAGTTRDVIEAPISLDGLPVLLIDTAGLRDARDPVESIGVDRARESLAAADILLWLGDRDQAPRHANMIALTSKCDLLNVDSTTAVDLRISSITGQGLDLLVEELRQRISALLPLESEVAINRRHRAILCECGEHLSAAELSTDLLITAEHLRLARSSLDRVTGRSGVEDMLNQLFGSFCIGK